MKSSDGGKGSAPRKQQDHVAYGNNYDIIFGKKKVPNEKGTETNQSKDTKTA